MDLLIAILMMMGVNASPDSFNDQEFLNRNSSQVEMAKDIAGSLEGTDEQKMTIVVGGGGNGVK